MKNLFMEIPTQLPEELVQTLVTSPTVRIERIVSRGHASPAGFWYDQPDDEWVVLLRGAAALRFSDNETLLQMRPGDYVHIPANRKHRVEWTDESQPTIWLAVHYAAS